MNRRTSLALTIALSSACLLAGSGIGHAQQSEADKVKAAMEGYHTAISTLDIKKMDEVWVDEPYVVFVGPRDKTVSIGWDAVRKDWKQRCFGFGLSLRSRHAMRRQFTSVGRPLGRPRLPLHPGSPRQAATR
jgi:hypothetical protein